MGTFYIQKIFENFVLYRYLTILFKIDILGTSSSDLESEKKCNDDQVEALGNGASDVVVVRR